jgi:nucleotide-binding universal stress UspA family protein
VAVRLRINGFGRIGRLAVPAADRRGRPVSATQGLLVGIDGSEQSLGAVDWAAAEAAARGCLLTVCHVSDAGAPMAPAPAATAGGRAAMAVADALARARAAAPGLRVAEYVRTGSPARELVRLAAYADELVVGDRGLGGFADLLLGSVGRQVAAHAPVPVVVIRPATKPDGPVLVGIEDTHDEEPALGYAFRHAARHRLALQVLYAFRDPITTAALGYPLPDIDHGQARQAAMRYLAGTLAPWQADFPDLPVEQVALGGPAAHTLIDASLGSSLLVIGRRGPAGLAGRLLGSVSQYAVRHAHCPVAVAG